MIRKSRIRGVITRPNLVFMGRVLFFFMLFALPFAMITFRAGMEK